MSVHFWVWSYCEIHWYVSTLGGCDHTVGFIGTSLHFWDVILPCDSLVCWYTSTILHSIASQKMTVCIVENMGTEDLTYPEEIFIYGFEEEKLFLKNTVWKLWCDLIYILIKTAEFCRIKHLYSVYNECFVTFLSLPYRWLVLCYSSSQFLVYIWP